MKRSAVTVFVCVACRKDGDADNRPGELLLSELNARLSPEDREVIAIEPVDCLAVCKRPATVALAGEGKWTYVIGDIGAEGEVDELVDSARRFAASENGVVPWKDRPNAFRKGVVSRTPPLGAAKAE